MNGEIYSKKGLGTSLAAAPLAWLALHIPGIGVLQTTYVFNMLVTALTAVVLFLYLLHLNYHRDVALLVGALFGVATLAWPYAGYLYSEPLTGLLLILAAYFLLIFAQQRSLLFLAGGGLAMGWAVVTRLTNLVSLPIYFAYALVPPAWDWLSARRDESIAAGDSHSGGERRRLALLALLRYAVVLSLTVGAGLLVIAAYNYVRFATPFRSGYAETAGFWTPLWEGLAGYFASPEKSLFVFAPIVLLPVVSIPFFVHRHPREGVFLLALFAVPTMLFAKWMDWEGGLAWGPRYLVALVPLLMPFGATGLAWLLGLSPFARPARLRGLRHTLAAVVAILALWSVSTQLLAASVNFVHYLRIPRALAATWQGSPWALSPPLLLWVFSPGIVTAELIDLAWFYRGPAGDITIAWTALATTAAFTLLSLAALCWVRARRLSASATTAFAVIAFLAAVLLTGFNLGTYYDDPRREAGDDYMELVAYLAAHEAPDDVLLVSSHVHMGFFMNYSKAHMKWYSLLSQEDDPTPDEITLLEFVAARHPRVWLAIDRVPQLGLPRPAEKWLSAHAYKLDERTFSDYSRLCLYATADPPDAASAQHPLDLDLGHGIRLAGFDLHPVDGHVAAGDTLRLSLLWESTATPESDYVVFVQIVGPDGKLVWQQDRLPADGFSPTSDWRAGGQVRDNYGLIVPAEWSPGTYRLIAGMYDPQSGDRLHITGASGDSIGDYVQLSEITNVTAQP